VFFHKLFGGTALPACPQWDSASGLSGFDLFQGFSFVENRPEALFH